MTPIEKVKGALEIAKRRSPTAISHSIYENALRELEGMVLVPIEPTDEMITAYLQPRGEGKTLKDFVTAQWKAMIAPYMPKGDE